MEKEMSDLLIQPIDSQLPSVSASKFAGGNEISCVYDKFPGMNYRLISLRKERIYYGTRTYKQNGQVVKEFERLVDAADLNYDTRLSREQMCISEVARAHADVTGACKDLIVQGGVSGNARNILISLGELVIRKWLRIHVLKQLWIIATRRSVRKGVLTPPIIRDMSDVHMKDAVVTLDEAHNVEDICSSTHLNVEFSALNQHPIMVFIWMQPVKYRDAASFTLGEKEIQFFQFWISALSSFMEKLAVLNTFAEEAVRREILDQSNRLKGEEKGEEAEKTY
uniref:RAD3-like helicase DEAD domain-containing protein n=1 Tax=Pristionchus pacificus TaxID=54126 RepID=A0A8R1Z4I0_PRIPA